MSAERKTSKMATKEEILQFAAKHCSVNFTWQQMRSAYYQELRAQAESARCWNSRTSSFARSPVIPRSAARTFMGSAPKDPSWAELYQKDKES